MSGVELKDRPEGIRRVTTLLAEQQRLHVPVFLEVPFRARPWALAHLTGVPVADVVQV